MRHARPSAAERGDLGIVEPDPVRQPDVRADPAPLGELVDGTPAEALEAVLLLVERFAQVGVEA